MEKNVHLLVHTLDWDPRHPLICYLTLFRSGGYQIDTFLPFSLYWLHGFHSESEQPNQNGVNTAWTELSTLKEGVGSFKFYKQYSSILDSLRFIIEVRR